MYAEVWLVNYAAMPFQLLLQQLPLSWKQCWGPVQWFSQNVLKKGSLEVVSLKNGEMSGLKFSPFPPIFHSIWNRCLPRFKTIQVHKACLYRRYWCYKLWWRCFVCLIFWTKGASSVWHCISHIMAIQHPFCLVWQLLTTIFTGAQTQGFHEYIFWNIFERMC